MGKLWAVDAIALFSQQNWTPLTVPCGFWRDYIFKVTQCKQFEFLVFRNNKWVFRRRFAFIQANIFS